LFWCGRWLHGQRVADIATRLIAAIPKRRISKCTIQETLSEHKWISNIQGALTVGVIVDYLQLWNILCDVGAAAGSERFSSLEVHHQWAIYCEIGL
jgi:hypothetical protein